MFSHFHVRLSRRSVLEVSAGLGLLLAVVLTCWMSSFCALADEVRANTLRLHVQANSDSEADQTLKLTVRDAVLEEARELGIVVLCTQHTNFTTCGLLYQAGIRGTDVRTGAK